MFVIFVVLINIVTHFLALDIRLSILSFSIFYSRVWKTTMGKLLNVLVTASLTVCALFILYIVKYVGIKQIIC